MPPPALPLGFFAFGLLALGAAIAGSAGGWTPLALLHLAAVGAFASIAMGALYQFVPVIGGSALRFPAAGFAHFVLQIAGTIGLVAGFQCVRFDVVGVAGILVGLGVVLQMGNLLATLWGKKGTPPPRMAAFALLWLAATVVAGIFAAFAFARAQPAGAALALHPILGIAGFFGTLIAAVSQRLLRMFERVDDERLAPLSTLVIALAAFVALWNLTVGTYAMLAAALFFGWGVARIGMRRNPAYQRETFLFAALSAAGAIAAATYVLIGQASAAIACALWLFVGSAIVGYIQRIIPFIWWIVRAQREGAKNIPTLGTMNATRLGYAIFGLWAIAGIWWVMQPFALGATLVGCVAWCGLIAQLARPFVVRRA